MNDKDIEVDGDFLRINWKFAERAGHLIAKTMHALLDRVETDFKGLPNDAI